jgi:hypothetical protein
MIFILIFDFLLYLIDFAGMFSNWDFVDPKLVKKIKLASNEIEQLKSERKAIK